MSSAEDDGGVAKVENVHPFFYSPSGKWRLRCTYYPFGATGVRKESKDFNSKEEASANAKAWTSSLSRPVEFRRRKRSISPRESLGHLRATCAAVANGADDGPPSGGTQKQALKRKRGEGQGGVATAEDSRRSNGKLARALRASRKNRRRPELKVHQYASYMRKRILEIEARIVEREGKIKSLRGKALRGELADLLDCEEGSGDNAPPGVRGISAAQHIRLERQVIVTSRFYEELVKWDRKGVDLAREALAEAYDGGVLTEKASGALLEGRRKMWEQRKDSNVTSIAEEVASSGGCGVASSTVLAWFRRYDRMGRFASDGRGKHERDWVLHEKGLLDQFVAFIKGEKCATVKKVTDFVNEKLLSQADAGASRTESGVAIGLEGPVSHTTVHQWMLRVGFEYDRASQSFFMDGQKSPEVVDGSREVSGGASDTGVA